MIRKGDWICDGARVGIAQCDEQEGMVDIALYALDGERVGRESPAEGGPKNFEPCCGAENWKRIERPKFPLRRFYDIKELVEFLP